MSLGPWDLECEGAKKSGWPKLVTLGGVFHQPDFSLCAVGSLKLMACFWASSCAWASLSGLASPWWRDQNSVHQFGGSSLLARYVRTQSFGVVQWIWSWHIPGSNPTLGSSGVMRLVATGTWYYGWGGRWTWSIRLLDCIFRFGVSSGCSHGSMVASWASQDSSLFSRHTACSTSVGDILGPSSVGTGCEICTIFSLFRCIWGTIHLWRSCAALHRTLGGVSDLSAKCCRVWASAKVSPCLVTQKSLVPGKLMGGMKSLWP